jgi:hypothetical protein
MQTNSIRREIQPAAGAQMISNRLFWAVATLLLLLVIFGTRASAQSGEAEDFQVDALKADLKADKAQIVQEAMQLNADESKPFWAVYKEYDKELSPINDELVTLAKQYSEKFGSIHNEDATSLTLKALDLQSRRVALKKKYFSKFSKATTPLTAAKFFQLENRLELLLNLKIASELPALLVQRSPATAEPKPASQN